MMFIKISPGLLFSSIIALLAMEMSSRYPALGKTGFSVLTLAILIGIVIGNMPAYKYLISHCTLGINFSKQKVLRLGIILYGFRLTFQDIGMVGLSGILIDFLTLTSTFALAVYLGVKCFNLDRETSILIGAGNSICGAAAILATEPVVKADNNKVTIAISTVVIFGTLAIFIYPVIYTYAPQDPAVFGIYIGSTVHEVAQVVAAADSIGDQVTNTAVIAKMVRVIMLGPFLIALAAYLTYADSAKLDGKPQKLTLRIFLSSLQKHVPQFAILFLVAIAFNSTGIVTQHIRDSVIILDNFLLALAMGALGLTTHMSSIAKAGIRPIKLAFILFGWLLVGGGLINFTVTKLNALSIFTFFVN